MANVYQSLRDVVQDTFQRGKNNPTLTERTRSATARTLDDEVAEFEKLLFEKIERLKARVAENEEWVAGETKHAEDLIEELRVKSAALESKIKEMEKAAQANDLSRQKTEETLRAAVARLQDEVGEKGTALQRRSTEVDELKSAIEAHRKEGAELSAALAASRTETANQSRRLEELVQNSNTRIAALEARLIDANTAVRENETALKRTEETLNGRIADLQTQLIRKDELLNGRDAEINTLRSQLKGLTSGIEQMALLFRRAEALAAGDAQGTGAAKAEDAPAATTDNGSAAVSKGTSDAAVEPDASADVLSDGAFGQIIHELAGRLNVIGVVASMIVREHVTALGESMENFPRSRLEELLESLGKEMLNKDVKAVFRESLANL